MKTLRQFVFCGRIGHKMDTCPTHMTAHTANLGAIIQSSTNSQPAHDHEQAHNSVGHQVDMLNAGGLEEEFGPWMLVQRREHKPTLDKGKQITSGPTTSNTKKSSWP